MLRKLRRLVEINQLVLRNKANLPKQVLLV